MNVLQTALCNLKDELMESNYFTDLYEYVEVIEDGDKTYPQYYVGNGNYTKVYNFDVNGSGYVRKRGDISTSLVSQDLMSCSGTNPLLDLTVPLRLVCAVPKRKLADTGFSDDTLALDLITYIGGRHSGITGVQSVHGHVVSYSTDRNKVWSQEVHGVDKQVDLTLSFISIDFNIVIRASLDCIRINCNY